MKQTSIEIIKKIRDCGHQALWAGGCVRDILMHKEPKDFDIVTSAKPEEIEKLLPKTLTIGKKFGIIIAVEGKHLFEIATFRGEGRYLDARRPQEVYWTDAKNDALRRDFTINGMFYDPIERKVIDYTGGQSDLENKIIRFIGNPDDRIKEDNLRILRAVRFKNILGFKYEKRTLEAIKNNGYRIQSVSSERVKNELNAIFCSQNRADALVDLEETGLLKYILPEISRLKGLPEPDQYHHEGDTFTHSVFALRALPAIVPLYLVWAVLLHDSGKYPTISFPKNKSDRIRFNKHVKYSAGIASIVLRRLKFPNYERRLIVWLVKNHMIVGDIPKMKISKQRTWLMHPWFPILLKLHKADAEGTRPVNLNLYKTDLTLYNKLKSLLVEEKKKPKFKLVVNGNDLIKEFSLESGPKIGKILKTIEELQLEGKINSKKEALDYVRYNVIHLTSIDDI